MVIDPASSLAWQLRPAQDEDNALAQTWHARRLRQAWGVAPDGSDALEAVIRQQCAWREAAYVAAHGLEGCQMIVAHDDPSQCLGRLWTSRRGDDWHLVDLLIAPAARRRGLARSCLAWLQTQAATLSLDVDVDNLAARHLYEQAGFTVRSHQGADLCLVWQRADRAEPSPASLEIQHEQA